MTHYSDVIGADRAQNIKSERKKEINTYADKKMKKLNRTSSEINRDIFCRLEKKKEKRKIKSEDKLVLIMKYYIL